MYITAKCYPPGGLGVCAADQGPAGPALASTASSFLGRIPAPAFEHPALKGARMPQSIRSKYSAGDATTEAASLHERCVTDRWLGMQVWGYPQMAYISRNLSMSTPMKIAAAKIRATWKGFCSCCGTFIFGTREA